MFISADQFKVILEGTDVYLLHKDKNDIIY